MRKMMDLNFPFAQYHFAAAEWTNKRRFKAFGNAGEDLNGIRQADGSEHVVTAFWRGPPRRSEHRDAVRCTGDELGIHHVPIDL